MLKEIGANGYGRVRAVFDEWQVRAWAHVLHISCSAVYGNGYLSHNGRHIPFNMDMVKGILFNQKFRQYFGIVKLKSPLGCEFVNVPDLVRETSHLHNYTARQQLQSTAEGFAEKSLALYDVVSIATNSGLVQHSPEELLSVAQSTHPTQ